MLLLPMPRLSNVQHLHSSDSFTQDLCRNDCNISPVFVTLLLVLLLRVLRFSEHLCMAYGVLVCISSHDARLVRRQVLWNAAANALMIKCAAPAEQQLIYSGPLPQWL